MCIKDFHITVYHKAVNDISHYLDYKINYTEFPEMFLSQNTIHTIFFYYHEDYFITKICGTVRIPDCIIY